MRILVWRFSSRIWCKIFKNDDGRLNIADRNWKDYVDFNKNLHARIFEITELKYDVRFSVGLSIIQSDNTSVRCII